MAMSLLKCNNGDFNIGYNVFEPKNRTGEPLPLIVFLHGLGERGNGTTELDRATAYGLPKCLKDGLDCPAVVIVPQCPLETIWSNIPYAVKELIDKIVEEYNIDKNRISLTGWSMGGFGTWDIGTAFPRLFSAIAPVCGGGKPWLASELKDVPVWAFHGEDDPIVPLNCSVDMVDAINKEGGNARLTIFHGVGHGSWQDAYTSTNVVEWLIGQTRNSN